MLLSVKINRCLLFLTLKVAFCVCAPLERLQSSVLGALVTGTHTLMLCGQPFLLSPVFEYIDSGEYFQNLNGTAMTNRVH